VSKYFRVIAQGIDHPATLHGVVFDILVGGRSAAAFAYWLDPHPDHSAATIGLMRGSGTWVTPDGIDASNDLV
jgi:hypothetical protein